MHDVDDEIAVVQQHPLSFVDAFARARGQMPALEVHVLLDLFRDADHLALVHGGGDHHDVGDGEQVADIERLDVGGFHAVGRDCGDAHGINGTLDCCHWINAPKRASSPRRCVVCFRNRPSNRPARRGG